MKTFTPNFLDHVAIRVKDIEVSVHWYETVIGLKRLELPEWRNYPVVMSCGKTGIAIFPANLEYPEANHQVKNIGISHFAFNVSNEDFEKAKQHFTELLLAYDYEDHYYFQSLYIQDPDGLTVELTTLMVAESVFYN